MVIFAVLTVFWLFLTNLTIGVPIVTGLPRLYQQCINSVPIVKNSEKQSKDSQNSKNDDWCTNRHMSTQHPLNTQNPRPRPPNTQSPRQLCHKLHWLPVYSRTGFKLATLCFKSHIMRQPYYLAVGPNLGPIMNLHVLCDHRHNIFFLYHFVTLC